MAALTARRGGPLKGAVAVPGDKSISHRALMFSALAAGRSRVRGLLEADDVMATAAALRALGARVERLGAGEWQIDGAGIGGLTTPDDVLDFGNSGTGARLVAGIVAGHPIRAVFTGDESLRQRPMKRIVEPLSRMGAEFDAAPGGRLPLVVRGAAPPCPIRYRLPVASAQVKSAILLAGLGAPGVTTVVEPAPTRDHSERMLRAFGAEVRVEADGEDRIVSVVGEPELEPCDLTVANDPSSAAFPLVAALIVPGSEVTVAGVGLNPLRTGLYETLSEMGADVEIVPRGERSGEPVGDVTARHSPLAGVVVPAARAPRMIDEYPVLAAAAACADGPTRFEGIGELRHKESDRLTAIAAGLAACGIAAAAAEDSLTVDGGGGARPPGGARIASRHDHRIAMAFLVLGLASERPVGIDDDRTIDTSFPGFAASMRRIGADIAAA